MTFLIRAQGKVAALTGHKPQLGKAVGCRHQLFDLRGILLLEIVHGSHAPCMKVFGARLRGGSNLPPPSGGVMSIALEEDVLFVLATTSYHSRLPGTPCVSQ